jgi:hypothetical protein
MIENLENGKDRKRYWNGRSGEVRFEKTHEVEDFKA